MEQGKIMETEVPTVQVGWTNRTNGTPTPTIPPRFLQAGCPSCHLTNSVKSLEAKALKAINYKSQK